MRIHELSPDDKKEVGLLDFTYEHRELSNKKDREQMIITGTRKFSVSVLGHRSCPVVPS